MFKKEFKDVLATFVKNADELDLKWKREGEELFSLQIFFKTKSKILCENKLFFDKDSVHTDLGAILGELLVMATEIAPGIRLNIDGIPNMAKQTLKLEDLIKPQVTSDFTLLSDELDDFDEFEEEEECQCGVCRCARNRVDEEAVQAAPSIESLLGLLQQVVAKPQPRVEARAIEIPADLASLFAMLMSR